MSNNKAISAVTPETFISNNVESLNNVQSNILSNMNSNKVAEVTKGAVTTSSSNDTFFYFIIIFLIDYLRSKYIFIIR